MENEKSTIDSDSNKPDIRRRLPDQSLVRERFIHDNLKELFVIFRVTLLVIMMINRFIYEVVLIHRKLIQLIRTRT
jgi:hypothetical protein